MYKVNDDVLFTVGDFEVPAKIMFLDKDGKFLIEVYSSRVRGFKHSQLYGIYGDNMTWADENEIKPYKAHSNPILVYCAHIHEGKSSNIADMTKRLRNINAKYSEVIAEKEYVFVSPLNALPFYELVDYEEGMRQCTALLSKCQMLVLFGKDHDKSKGVAREIDYCKLNRISIVTEEEFMNMLEGK